MGICLQIILYDTHMGFIVWSIVVLTMMLLYVVYTSMSLYQEKYFQEKFGQRPNASTTNFREKFGQPPKGATELFGNRDRPIDSATGQALPIHNNETADANANANGGTVGNRFPGQQVTAPEIIAPATHQGVLADYSISVDKPYDDFVSPEPHHLEQIHPKTLNAACNQFNGNKATCQSSRLCVYIDDGIGGPSLNGGACVAAFSNTTNARANNNYMSKTMPQGDLSYYYKDGVCYGDCDGWSPKYAHPDPIVVANLKNDNKTGVSFAGMLTPAEMYNRKNIPLVPGPTLSSSSLTRMPTIGTIMPNMNIQPSIDDTVSQGRYLVNNLLEVGLGLGLGNNALDICQPKCSTGYVCETNRNLGIPVCVAKGPTYGDNRACNLQCGQNYRCQLNVLDQPMCMPILE